MFKLFMSYVSMKVFIMYSKTIHWQLKTCKRPISSESIKQFQAKIVNGEFENAMILSPQGKIHKKVQDSNG